MRVMRILVFLLLGILYFGQISGIIGQDLSALVVDVSDMGDGSISQARLEAQRQARSGGLPFRSFTRGEIRTFVGQYTPPEFLKIRRIASSTDWHFSRMTAAT